MNPSYEIPQRQTRATTASTTTTTTTGGERSLSPGEQITRRSTRRKRNANGELVESQAVSQDTRTPVKPSAAPGHSSKRPRITKKVPPNSSAAPQVPIKAKNEPGYESINLIEIDDDDGLQQLLSKKQEAILKTQVEGQEKPKLSDFKCVICLDDPKDLAATPCGKLFDVIGSISGC